DRRLCTKFVVSFFIPRFRFNVESVCCIIKIIIGHCDDTLPLYTLFFNEGTDLVMISLS
ncbi:MAG: hypothetical protein ACJAQ6_001395, partial [Arenicella sp.]